MSIFPQAVAEAGLSSVKALKPSKTYQLDFLSPSVLDTVYGGEVPPAHPAIGELWRNMGGEPPELLKWTGKATNTARRFSASKSGAIVSLDDISDVKELRVKAYTTAIQNVTTQSANLLDLTKLAYITLPTTGVATTVSANQVKMDYTGANAYAYSQFTLPFEKIKGKTIYFKATCPTNPTMTIMVYTLNSSGAPVTSVKNMAGSTSLSGSVAFPSTLDTANGIYGYCIIFYMRTNETTTTTLTYSNIMMSATDIAYTPFVPQSPSPDYPAPINPAVAVGANLVVKRTGVNLFNNSASIAYSAGATLVKIPTGVRIVSTLPNSFLVCYFDIGSINSFLGKTITLKGSFTASWSNMPRCIIAYANDGYTVRSSALANTTGAAVSFTVPSTPPEGVTRLGIGFYANYNGTTRIGDYVDYTNVQLEVGNKATAYEPYSGNDYALPVQQALYGMPGAEDERGSDGYGLHNTRMLSITGNEAWALYNSDALNAIFRLPSAGTPYAQTREISSHFANGGDNVTVLGNPGTFILGLSGNLYIQVPVTIASSLTAFKAWLAARNSAGTPVQILYQLASPTTETLPAVTIASGSGTPYLTLNAPGYLSVDYTATGWAAQYLYMGLPIIDGETAIRQAIHKAIMTNMTLSSIYDGSYGSELETLVGSTHTPAYLQSEIPRMIRDALIYDDRISGVSGFTVTVSGDLVYVEFTVTLIDGAKLQITEAVNV